jgi:hypothetical protein
MINQTNTNTQMGEKKAVYAMRLQKLPLVCLSMLLLMRCSLFRVLLHHEDHRDYVRIGVMSLGSYDAAVLFLLLLSFYCNLTWSFIFRDGKFGWD